MTNRPFSIAYAVMILAAGAVWAAENPDLPTDAPSDAVMASPAEVQAVSDWASAAFHNASVATRDAQVKSDVFIAPARPFSFRYGGADSRDLLKTWEHRVESKDSADRVQHQVTWTDPSTGLAVIADVTCFKRYPAVEWVLYFENRGTTDTPILENIQAVDTELQTQAVDRPLILHQLIGEAYSERTFLPTQTTIECGKSLTMAPEGGRPSSGAFPFFNSEYAGQGVMTAIGWTGQWAATVARTAEGPTRLTAGMEKTHLRLHPGERIRSPRVLLMPWKGDRLAAHQRFRRLLMFCYTPKQAGHPLQLPFALEALGTYIGAEWDAKVRNGWIKHPDWSQQAIFEAATNAVMAGEIKYPDWPTEAGQLALIKKAREIGCDYYWLDAYWFKGGVFGFANGVGNWFCEPKGFPNGLKPLGDAAHQLGMKFILWFEPERVTKGTLISRDPYQKFVWGGYEGGLFKLGDPDARRWMTDLLSQRITEFGVDVFRIDLNMLPLSYWRQADAPDREGMTEIRHVEGFYAMLDELIARHPGLWIDTVASGGRRIDLETVKRSVFLWRSDTACSPGHAEWDQNQSLGLGLYLPLFATGCWTPAAYDVRSAATGGMACEFDYLNATFPLDQAKAALAEAKENQKYWYGDFYPLTPATLAVDQWTAFQLHRADLNAGLVLAFRRSQAPNSVFSVKLGGIDSARNYVVEFIDEARQKVKKTLPGRLLAESLDLSLPNQRSSLVVRYRLEEVKMATPP